MKSNIKHYHCDERLFTDLLKHSTDGWRAKILDFPEDAVIECIIANLSQYKGGVFLRVSSESFDELKEGDEIPVVFFSLYRERVSVIANEVETE